MREEGEKEDPVNGGGEWVLKTGNQNEKEGKRTDYVEGSRERLSFRLSAAVVEWCLTSSEMTLSPIYFTQNNGETGRSVIVHLGLAQVLGVIKLLAFL